jgi:hypothetical protein
MATLQRLQEVRDILEATLAASHRAPATLVRAHRLLELAIGDFFSEADDEAALAEEPAREPFPAA